jgi:peptide/nickel transport system permease protein
MASVAVSSKRAGGTLVGAERESLASPGLYRRAWRVFSRDRVAMFGLALLAVIVAFALAAPLVSHLTGFTYFENHLRDKLAAPGEKGYVLGSDANGRDILTRLAYAGRVSLLVGLCAALSEILIGLVAGVVAGYYGGLTDSIIMRIVEVFICLPIMPLLLLITSFYEPTLLPLALVIGALSWPGDARLLRGEVLALRNREYIEGARVVGAPGRVIMLRHVLPNITPILIILVTFTVSSTIFIETFLSFLGLGVQVPTPSWGNMMNDAQRFYRTNWTAVFFPGFLVYLTCLALYLVGSGLRDALDPKLLD